MKRIYDFQSVLTSEKIKDIVQLIPDEWLLEYNRDIRTEARDMYFRFLEIRMASSKIFIKEAQNARAALI